MTQDPDVAYRKSEEVLLEVPNNLGQHHGGTIAFSPVAGMLYVVTGRWGICTRGRAAGLRVEPAGGEAVPAGARGLLEIH